MMKINACAKLNFALNIESPRADGYHNMQMIMQSVDLCDTLSLEFNRNVPLSIVCDMPIIGDNIVTRAVHAFANEVGYPIGGNIHITKRIPICGGLGGGSADAAAVLTALNLTFGGVSEARLSQIVLSLGADVPFALTGGTQYASGVGERLCALPAVRDCTVLLAGAGEKDSTGKMFARFDSADNKFHPDVESAVRLLRVGNFDMAARHFGNSFYPLWQGSRTAEIDRIMRANGAVCVSLSGAGPTMFGLFKNENGPAAAQELSKFTWCALCRPTEKSIIIE